MVAVVVAIEPVRDKVRLFYVWMATNTCSVLPRMKTDITIEQGCSLRGWMGGCVATTSYQSRSVFLLLLQSFSSALQCRWGLSKCH